ncbi:MAG: hypothetical protein COA36_11820 [Desulfotalea sp.]|nr:MAG: hypothetical protein COA36_11820 [Desulfotalea sp.]
MATPKKRINKNGTISWKIQVQVKGQRATASFDTHLDAVIWADRQEKIFRGEIQPEVGTAGSGDMIFHQAADKFIVECRATNAVSPSQIHNYANSQLQFSRTFGINKRMSEITPQDVAAHVLKRMTEDQVGAPSIRNELSFIRSIFTKAIEWGIDYPSPELKIKRPRSTDKSKEEKLDHLIKLAELKALLHEATKRSSNLYQYITFLLYTGMRPSEAAMLLWEQLPTQQEKKSKREYKHIGYVDLDRGGFSMVGTKTSDKRFVPAHPKVIKIIEELRETAPEGKKLVFLDDKHLNTTVASKHYRRTFKTTCDNARINGEKLRGGISLYSFRHTFRSTTAKCKIPTEVGEAIIGHNDKSFKFTYIHLEDDILIEAIRLLQYDI